MAEASRIVGYVLMTDQQCKSVGIRCQEVLGHVNTYRPPLLKKTNEVQQPKLLFLLPRSIS